MTNINISEEKYTSMMETIHLCVIPGMAIASKLGRWSRWRTAHHMIQMRNGDMTDCDYARQQD